MVSLSAPANREQVVYFVYYYIRMHSSWNKYWLSALAASLILTYTDGAKTTVSCADKACLGQPFDINCEISGDVESGISWTRPKDNIVVVTCNKEVKCVPSDTGYEVKNTPTGQTLTIKKFNKNDLGLWICRDGDRELTQKCDVSSNMTAPVGRLNASCAFALHNRKQLFASCAGISSLGFPSVAVKMKVEGLDVDPALSPMKYRANLSLDSAGKVVSCSLEGPAAQCTTASDSSVTCPQVSSGHECVSDGNCMTNAFCSDSSCTCRMLHSDTDGLCNLNVGGVVGIVIGCLALIALVIVGIMYFLQRKGRTTKKHNCADGKTDEAQNLRGASEN